MEEISERDKILAQQKRATENRLLNVIGRLKAQWSMKESKHCLHNDWHALARSVGLSSSEIPALQAWVAETGRKPPVRKKETIANMKLKQE